MRWTLEVQTYEEKEEAVSPVGTQPTIAEVKRAWIEEATRFNLIGGHQDPKGLRELKTVLGSAYTNLAPGGSVQGLKAEGIKLIQLWRQNKAT